MPRFLTLAGLTLAASVNLAACGQYVQNAQLGRCTALPASGGSLCEEIGGEYIFVDGMTRSMQRVSAAQAQLITQVNGAFAAAQPAGGGAAGGQRNCLANPGIACSGALNNRVTGYRSGGYSGVCSGGQCLSMGR
jgi:hypothetical protein